MQIIIEPYPHFKPAIFSTQFPTSLAEFASPEWLVELLSIEAPAPVQRSEEIRKTVRDLLRHKGYKPTGRGKPASEYLVRAAENGYLGSINAPVDTCNVVSLHSGLPISMVDLEKASPPFLIKPGEPDTSYVFNQSGQEINVSGLLCLHDAAGPCANAVKDAQRTKTSEETRQTLSIIWGPETLKNQTETALAWYVELLVKMGAMVEIISS